MSIPSAPSPTSDAASWSMLAAMLFGFLLLQKGDEFTIASGTALLPISGLTAMVLAATGFRLAGWPRGAAATIGFLQISLFTLFGILLSYAVAANAGPLWDHRLGGWDLALGLDWPAVARAVDGAPLLPLLCGLAYHSLIPQMVVAVVALSALAKHDALRTTICAAILAGFVTILLSGLFPAKGNLLDPALYQKLWPSIAWLHEDLITNLRNGSMRELDLRNMMGIVTFPSYHAALAFIFIYAFRHIPRLAMPGGAWACTTILATPLGGGHYAVDVVAGLALAAFSLGAAKRLVRLRIGAGPALRSKLESREQPAFAPRT